MSKRTEIETERMQKLSETMSEEFLFAIEDKAKIIACNLMLIIGSKGLEKGDGFVVAACQLAQAIVLNMADEGFLTFSASGLASEEELAEREKDLEPKVLKAGLERPVVGQYL